MKSTAKICIVTLLVSIDALSKAVCLSALPGRDITLIDNVLSLRLTYNTGAAFSLLEGTPALACLLSAAITVACAIYLLRAKLPLRMQIPLCAITAGGLGNLTDRLLHGAVTDMISFDFINFPVFNFADICVTAGAFILALAVLSSKEGDTF